MEMKPVITDKSTKQLQEWRNKRRSELKLLGEKCLILILPPGNAKQVKKLRSIFILLRKKFIKILLKVFNRGKWLRKLQKNWYKWRSVQMLLPSVRDISKSLAMDLSNNGLEFSFWFNGTSIEFSFEYVGITGELRPNGFEKDVDNDFLRGGPVGDDSCPHDPENDIDGDKICGNLDSCPYDAKNDVDGDGICGDQDSCPIDFENGTDGN